VHIPATQACVGAHATPHAPQFVALVIVSTHDVPQRIWPGGQPHTPPVQTSPAPQALPQAPQLAESVATLVHTDAHSMVGSMHAGATTPKLHAHVP